MFAPARSQIAASAPARSSPAASGAKAKWAAVAAALMCLWTAYADPVARERALALLRPALADIAPSAAPFKLGAASAHREDVGGQPVLFVEGSLANATKRKRRAPVLRVSLIGDDGQPLYSWKTKPAVAEIAPGADVAYRTRLASPPPAFKSIEVSLAD